MSAPSSTKVIVRELSAVAALLLTIYSCVVGASYAVFVPQACYHTYGHGVNATVASATCTFEENTYVNLDFYNIVVVAFNVFTVLVLLGGFAMEFARERYIMENFDLDFTLPDSNLAGVLLVHPKVKETLHKYNKTYFVVFCIILFINLINMGLSAYLIYIWYDGYRSAITFLTNTIILFSRLINSIWLAYECDKEQKACSANLFENLTFNVLAPSYNQGSFSSTLNRRPGVQRQFGLGCVPGRRAARLLFPSLTQRMPPLTHTRTLPRPLCSLAYDPSYRRNAHIVTGSSV
jgi:hypothetical protein